ncbi:hypothetical protein EYF80_027248 [Liparis tanakae]|uniref:Uncharacterized protein n=1 Tax=Liparis tanakae TaxID=230148 RepID=A0A4Z2HB98_9TELE|nr:hypothetical protein EYF80_027248 [Liparis tanakae]
MCFKAEHMLPAACDAVRAMKEEEEEEENFKSWLVSHPLVHHDVAERLGLGRPVSRSKGADECTTPLHTRVCIDPLAPPVPWLHQRSTNAPRPVFGPLGSSRSVTKSSPLFPARLVPPVTR